MKVICYLLISITILSGCGLATTRPKLEMRLAQEAFIAAKDADAQKLASAAYRKAEFYYLKAKSSYRRKFFNKAKQYAVLSKQFSERAENIAVRKAALEDL